MPRKLRNSDTLIGRTICWIASTLSGSGDIPEPPNTTPKNVTLGLLNSHFRLTTVMQCFEDLIKSNVMFLLRFSKYKYVV